jgi:tetratricopeptide (TPR) repeat protein
MTMKEVMKELKAAPPETVIKDVTDRGVDFDMDQDTEKKLRKNKATDAVIQAVREEGPKVRAQTSKMILGPGAAGIKQIPNDQAQAFNAIKSELDPDKAIALVNDFAGKYPSSPLLGYVYSFGANAYQQKGDVDGVIDYADKGLKAEPDNIMCLIMKLGILPQPQYLNNHPADRDKILQEATNEGALALQLIAKVPKQPTETDADYQKRMADIASEIHAPLGMVHLDEASESLVGVDHTELGKAEQEFQTAVSTTTHPDPRDYFRMGEAYAMDGKIDDAIKAFTKAGELGQGTLIKTYSDQRIEALKKRQAQTPAASKP